MESHDAASVLDGKDTGHSGIDYGAPITWRNLVLDPR
jgi:hypothetical protein